MKAAWLLLCAGLALAAPNFQSIVVQPGDTLWGIAQRYLKDPKRWDELLNYNELPTRDPTVALPGMTLRVPVEMVKERLRAARLIELRNEVLHRKRETADWNPARLLMDLYPDDGLRTTASAEAKVQFAMGELLSMGENSMVILSPPRKESDLKLMAGEVRGRKARVLTASALITPKTADTSFSARVKDDMTTLVQVYSGRAAVEAQGKTIELKAGFASEVPLDRPPSAPIPLPALPSFAAKPVAQETQVVLSGAKVSLKLPASREGGEDGAAGGGSRAADGRSRQGPIEVGEAIQAYHLQVATDKDFNHIVFDERETAMKQIDLDLLPLPNGHLWWRVALIDLLGFEGQFSAARPYDSGPAVVPKH